MMEFMQRIFRRNWVELPEKEREASIALEWCAGSDIGCCRGNNEDNLLVNTSINEDAAAKYRMELRALPKGRFQLAGVFDGMGGGEAGELASAAAAKMFRDALPAVRIAATRAEADIIIRNAFLRANNAVLEYMNRYRIFGTTGTVALMEDNRYKIYHLGDSRAYSFSKGRLTQLTKDQTLAQLKMDSGLYDAASPRAEAEKHQLTEYIGKDLTGRYICPVEYAWCTAAHGDMLLLCSDGLYDACTDAEMEALLSSAGNLGEKTDALVSAALKNHAQDNVTCILIHFL